MLAQLYKGYTNLDPGTKQQKAIPISILRKLYELAESHNCPVAIAIAQLAIGAFFFCMRSCEYSKTCTKEESKRTKILRIRNIRFFKNNRLLPHSHPHLHLADYVNITFEYQKNDERNESVGMYRAEGESYFCPVFIWAQIIRRLYTYPSTTSDTKVNLTQQSNSSSKLIEITSNRIRTKLRAAATVIGAVSLGFKAMDIGTHSIRSGAAMALFLAGTPCLTIMIIGRWRSDAFLRYIRKHVATFSINLSTSMLQSEHFFTTPDFQTLRSSNDTNHPSATINGLSPAPRGIWQPVS